LGKGGADRLERFILGEGGVKMMQKKCMRTLFVLLIFSVIIFAGLTAPIKYRIKITII